MDKYLQNQLYKQLEAYIINMNLYDLKLSDAGFIVENCSSFWLPILLNCIENINIFNVEQKNNIANIINNLRYGRR